MPAEEATGCRRQLKDPDAQHTVFHSDRHRCRAAGPMDRNQAENVATEPSGKGCAQPSVRCAIRFPNTVYETVYPSLIREVLSGADVHALTGFYSLVDQMNRGLDVIERYRAADDQPHLVQEVSRLRKKAAEMQHPELHLTMPAESAFYTGAIAAVKRHSGEK
jgi:hypothetical protein